MKNNSDINTSGEDSDFALDKSAQNCEHVIRRINNMFAVHSQNSTMHAMQEALLRLAKEGLLNE